MLPVYSGAAVGIQRHVAVVEPIGVRHCYGVEELDVLTDCHVIGAHQVGISDRAVGRRKIPCPLVDRVINGLE